MEGEIISRSYLFLTTFEVKFILAALPFTWYGHWFLPLLFLQVLHLLTHINICVYIWTEMNKGQSRAKILMYLQGKKHEILYLSS